MFLSFQTCIFLTSWLGSYCAISFNPWAAFFALLLIKTYKNLPLPFLPSQMAVPFIMCCSYPGLADLIETKMGFCSLLLLCFCLHLACTLGTNIIARVYYLSLLTLLKLPFLLRPCTPIFLRLRCLILHCPRALLSPLRLHSCWRLHAVWCFLLPSLLVVPALHLSKCALLRRIAADRV